MAKSQGGHFGRGLFDFFRELEKNNDRTWFTENKSRYVEQVEQPMLRFIGDFGERLKTIAPAFVALPTKTGGSLFRIHRDTRFSKDKSPYKTAVAAIFPHRDHPRDFGLPGFYVHLGPDECLGGGGSTGRNCRYWRKSATASSPNPRPGPRYESKPNLRAAA